MKEKRQISDYLADYTNSDIAKKIISCSNVLNNEGFDLWSLKKLILLEYYIQPYLNILSSRGYKCYYIDFFSSCGTNLIENGDIKVLGSPIISILKGCIPIKKKKINNRFNQWFFIEKEKEFCQALELRALTAIEYVREKFNENLSINKDIHIICNDCNIAIQSIVEKLEKHAENDRIAILAFIDPYSFSNIEWNTWITLLKLKYVDIIFTFPISTIRRGINVCKDKEKYLPPSLFDVCNQINEIPDHEFEKRYAQDICKLVKRDIFHYEEGIKIKNSKNSEIYRIEIFTHCKPALEITLPKAKELENITSIHLKSIIEQIFGKLHTLNDY